jgi:hypothetical protein
MRTILLTLVGAAALVAAQNDVSWISVNGNNANPCTRAQPCRDIESAMVNTKIHGAIHFVDSGVYTGAAIDKPVTIDGTGVAAVLTGSVNSASCIIVGGFFTGAEVNLRNLTCYPGPTPTTYGNGYSTGIHIIPDGSIVVNVEDVVVKSPVGGNTYIGFNVQGAVLNLRNVTVVGGLIGVQAGKGASVSLDRVSVWSPIQAGFSCVDSTATVRDSLFRNGGYGIQVSGSAGFASVTIERSEMSANRVGLGVVGTGKGAEAVLSESMITRNVGGLQATNGGSILSFKTNRIYGNDSNGAPTGNVSEQ